MEGRYIANNLPPQTLQTTPQDLLDASLEAILKTSPPRSHYPPEQLGGLYYGYTGLAYLFLRISALHPDVEILGHDALFWAEKYLHGDRGHIKVQEGNCGISCEKLCFHAVKACVTRDLSDVLEFVTAVPAIIARYTASEQDPYPSDLISGRAGALYLLRMVRHWVPGAEAYVASPMNRLVDRILETDDDGSGNWHWNSKRYYGAGHGDIGIITQLVLARPELAPMLVGRVENLLAHQNDGNWPVAEGDDGLQGREHPVQWCHGATGFLYSLQALRPFFPAMRPSHPRIREQIDLAIAEAQDLVWNKGLLTKEPSLCHGIFGNALCLPRGPKRDHFLALATPQSVQAIRGKHPKILAPASCGRTASVVLNYVPSSAWAWAVCDREQPGMLMYTDV